MINSILLKGQLIFKVILGLFIIIVSCREQKQEPVFIDIDNFYVKNIGFKEFHQDSLSIDLSILKKVKETNPIYDHGGNGSNSAEYYFYSILDTVGFNSLVFYYYNEGKETSLLLANYSKEGKLIDETPLFSNGGDAGHYYYTKVRFVDDKTLERKDYEENYEYNNDEEQVTIENESWFTVKIKANGVIEIE